MTLPETHIFAPEVLDGWKTFSFPFGGPVYFFGCELLVSGRVLAGGFKRFCHFHLEHWGFTIPNFDRRIFFIHGW